MVIRNLGKRSIIKLEFISKDNNPKENKVEVKKLDEKNNLTYFEGNGYSLFSGPRGLPSLVKTSDDKTVPRKSILLKKRTGLSLRGNRAATVAGGILILPHPCIASENFHKHISTELPSPMRMRQLLIWGLQSLLTKEILSKTEVEMIKELVKKLANKEICTSWYQRPPEFVENKPHGKPPNPKNLEIRRHLEHYQNAIKELKNENSSWETEFQSLRKSAIKLAASPNSLSHDDKKFLDNIDAKLARLDQEICNYFAWFQRFSFSTDLIYNRIFINKNYINMIMQKSEDLIRATYENTASYINSSPSNLISFNPFTIGIEPLDN